MAAGTGTKGDINIYENEFHTGLIEGIAQDINLFNAASRGAIIFDTNFTRGDYTKWDFIKDTSGALRYRDRTSIAAATDQKTASGEIIAPKLGIAFGPFLELEDKWLTRGNDVGTFGYVIGIQAGNHIAKSYLNAGLRALLGCLSKSADTQANRTAIDGTDLLPIDLVAGKAVLGDAANSIVCFITDSASYFSLMSKQVSNSNDLGFAVISDGNVRTLDLPMFYTDYDHVFKSDAGGVDTRRVFCLTPGAVKITQSSNAFARPFFERVGTLNNVAMRFRADADFNVEVKGFQWSATALPTAEATLATKGNWTQAVTSIKDGPGSMILWDNSDT